MARSGRAGVTTLMATALVPPVEARLRVATGALCLPLCGEWHAKAPALVCIDPSALDGEGADAAKDFAWRGVPIVFYTEYTLSSLHAVAASPLRAYRHLIFDVDDDVSTLARLAPDARAATVGAELGGALAAPLERLDFGLREAAEAVVQNPARFFDAVDLARHCGMSRRTTDRHFKAAGLAPAKHLVVASRAYWAIRSLSVARVTTAAAAAAVGYESTRALLRHARLLWGQSPRECAALPPTALLQGVRAFTLTEDGTGRNSGAECALPARPDRTSFSAVSTAVDPRGIEPGLFCSRGGMLEPDKPINCRTS